MATVWCGEWRQCESEQSGVEWQRVVIVVRDRNGVIERKCQQLIARHRVVRGGRTTARWSGGERSREEQESREWQCEYDERGESGECVVGEAVFLVLADFTEVCAGMIGTTTG